MKKLLYLPIVFFSLGCLHGTRTIDGYIGLTEKQLLARMGPPSRQSRFPGAVAQPGLRDTLDAKFRAAMPDDLNGEIRELHWDGTVSNTTVWFIRRGGEWVVLDALRWNRNVKF